MEIYFQKGQYPVRQVIFVELDSVLGSLITSGLLKPKYGTFDIIHLLRSDRAQTDAELLLLTTRPVVSTCWSAKRLRRALPAYVKARGWKIDDVRIYEIGKRIVT